MERLTKAALATGGAAALLPGEAGTMAFWTDDGLATGTDVTAGTLTVTDGACGASMSRALAYTATINGVAATVTDNGATRSVAINQTVLQQLFGGLFGGTLTVRVTAALPGTTWRAPVATETVQAGITALPPGLTLECTSPP